MALGRQRARQADMLVSWAELPRSPGHAFYDRLQAELIAAGFDGFVEGLCAPFYAARRGSVSSRASQYRSCSRTRCTAAALRGLQDAQRGHGAAEEEHSAAEGGDVLVAAGARAEEVAQLIVPSTEPRR
jgi:hypothetical protein